MHRTKTVARWIFLPILLAINVHVASSQEIIYVDTSFSIFSPQTVFGSLELGQCVDNLIDEELSVQFSYDVLVTPEGARYGYGPMNGFILDTLFFEQLDAPSTVQPYLDAITMSHDIRGMTCDENGHAYMAGRGISRLNIECCDWEETYLGDLPPDMRCQGDITYRKGKFYVAAFGNKLVEVDMKDPSKSKVVMDFPTGTLPIHGLATVQVGCDSVATYATGRAPDHSEVYEIDFDNWTISLLCDMPELAIDGAGSQTECMLPPCALFVDLDDDNSSFGFWGNHCADTFCVPPVAISDVDVTVLSGPGFLDSVTFELVDITDTGEEFLSISMANNITALGDGTTSLTLVDNGATLADFEDAIAAVNYGNSAATPSPGKRKVLVTGWAAGEPSPLSTAELPLFNPDIELQVQTMEPSCHGLSDGSIEIVPTGGTPSYQYQWENGLSTATVSGLGAGDYPVTVTDASGCATIETVGLDEPDTLVVDIAYSGLNGICDMSGTLIPVPSGGTYPFGYGWSNGTADSLNTGVGPGQYELTLTDDNGCTATASTSVASGDTVLVTQVESICDGGSLQWQNLDFAADTLACLTFQMANGCDSTLCLNLTVNPVPAIQFDTTGSFCSDDEVDISVGQSADHLWSTGETTPGITVDGPGIYSVLVTNAFGCTAEDGIDVPPGLEFTWSARDPGCTGDSDGTIEVDDILTGTPPYVYALDGGPFSGGARFEGLVANGYQLTVMDGSGCSHTVEIVLQSAEEITLDIGDDREVKLGEEVTLGASTNLLLPQVVTWQPPTGLDAVDRLSVVARPLETTLYTLEVFDSNGCSARDEVLVSVADISNVYVPTAFSPNGDGTNDVFRLYTDSSVEQILSMQIFDRWGGLVHKMEGISPMAPDFGWDGTVGGVTAQTGTYVFVAELLKVDGVLEVLTGEISLFR